jgi:ABC-type transport system involved in multi-copper enzyme maturation permease subunit
MSAVADIRPIATSSGDGRSVTQAQVIRSEWIKLWSLRSTRWSLAFGILGLLLGVVVAAFDMGRWSHLPLEQRLTYKSVDTTLIGWHLSELAIGVLGVLVITGEYSTGQIRSTFMAVPHRLPVLWAKIVVFASVTFVLALPMTFIGFYGASAVLSQHGVNPSLATPGALRCVLAIPLFLAVLAVFTVSLGALLRNTAGGIATFAAIIFVIPGLVGVLSNSLKNAINPYLPSNAAAAFFTAKPDPQDHLLAPWAGFGVFCAYTVVLLIAASVLLMRRDV